MIVAQTLRPPSVRPDIAAQMDAAANSTWPEKIVEFAGRVCYASEPNMGKGNGFIGDRVREGHEDIVEHGWISYLAEFMSPTERLKLIGVSRYVEISDSPDGVYVSGNLRVWRELIKAGCIGEKIATAVANVAPSVYADLVIGNANNAPGFNLYFPRPDGIVTDVELLGVCYNPLLADDRHQQATFLINGISRTCSHQLVRHRAGSYSQASQRYISLEKGAWEAIVPPAIAADSRALATLFRYWHDGEQAYAELRKYNIRKEDARFLLPNAAATKIVVSMNFTGWRHFLWLRALDKAAQWEIRYMAQDILRWLAAIAPQSFAKEMDYLGTNEPVLAGR